MKSEKSGNSEPLLAEKTSVEAPETPEGPGEETPSASDSEAGSTVPAACSPVIGGGGFHAD